MWKLLPIQEILSCPWLPPRCEEEPFPAAKASPPTAALCHEPPPPRSKVDGRSTVPTGMPGIIPASVGGDLNRLQSPQSATPKAKGLYCKN